MNSRRQSPERRAKQIWKLLHNQILIGDDQRIDEFTRDLQMATPDILNRTNRKGNTLLHIAVNIKGEDNQDNPDNPNNTYNNVYNLNNPNPDNSAFVEQLLQMNGIDVNIQNNMGNTPLQLAVQTIQPVCVELLLNHPMIDITIPDQYGRTPEDNARDFIAEYEGNPEFQVNYEEQIDPMHEILEMIEAATHTNRPRARIIPRRRIHRSPMQFGARRTKRRDVHSKRRTTCSKSKRNRRH